MAQTIQGHNDKINSIAVTPDGKFILSAGNDKTIRLWLIKNTGTCYRTFRGHSNIINAIAVTPDSRFFITGSKDCCLKVWDFQKNSELRSFTGHLDSVNTVAISSSGLYAVSGSSDCDLRQWDIRSGECLQVFKGHPAYGDRDGLNSLIRSSNSTFSYHDIIGHLGFATTYNEDNFNFFGHADPVTAVALSPDGRFLLSSSEDNTLRLWHTKSGKCLWLFGGRDGGSGFSVRAVAITPNGRYAISAGETLQSWKLTRKQLRRLLWGIRSEKPCRTFKETKGVLGGIAITPKGNHIAVIEDRGRRIGIYKIRTGKLLRAIDFFSDQANTLTVTSDGQMLVVGTISGVIHIYMLSELQRPKPA